MSKQIVNPIHRCKECPFVRLVDGIHNLRCSNNDVISLLYAPKVPLNRIPKWCPLDDLQTPDEKTIEVYRVLKDLVKDLEGYMLDAERETGGMFTSHTTALETLQKDAELYGDHDEHKEKP